jgi:alpha-mannosidase
MADSSPDGSSSAAGLDPEAVADSVDTAFEADEHVLERIREQVRFAAALANHHGNDEWAALVEETVEQVESADRGRNPVAVAEEVEQRLEPVGEVARTYTVHYVGHGHIDMNWLWDYPETAHTTYRAFSTMFDIMDEYPSFRFTQSQVSTYAMMAEHAPEIFDEIGARIADDQWEVAANTWVQADKNMSTGETQARSLLYSREFLAEELGVEATPVDFEPDTFGHPETVPKILDDAGIDYYYVGRTGGDEQPDRRHGVYDAVPQLFRWQSPDGSEVIAFNGAELWYNGHIDPGEVTAVLGFEDETGVREFLDLYGVGNHGGGPTRADVETIGRMNEWPVFPETVPSTLSSYFEAVEAAGTNDLPVVQDDLNYIFRGCYSSQSRAKQYNRRLEARLPTAEALAVVASEAGEFDYPRERLREAWQQTIFNQFHDILPGAGVPEAFDHALGRYQEAEAAVDLVCDRALEAIGEDLSLYHEDTAADAYADEGVPVLVFNPTGQSRTEHVRTLVYDYPEEWDVDDLVAVGPDGTEHPVQALETNEDVGHKIRSGEYAQNRLPDPSRLMHDVNFGPNFVRVGATVTDVPAYGYSVFLLRERESAGERDDGPPVRRGKDEVTLENDRYRVTADARRGALTSLYDSQTDTELVPDGELFAQLSIEHEVPHGMSAWLRGQVASEEFLDEGWELEVIEDGVAAAAVRWERDYRDSTLQVELRLPRGTDTLEWSLDAHWRELGGDDRGVPVLRLHFPVDVSDPTVRADLPYGSTEREADGMDVPAYEWVDLRGADGTGLTVSNDTTHGHSASDGTLSLTLLRSSYSPDTEPEAGRRKVACSLRPHGPEWTDADAARHGRSVARDPVVEQLLHDGVVETLARSREFVSIDTDRAEVTAIKRAVDGDGVVVRVHERAGGSTDATVSVDWPFEEAVSTSLVEEPTGEPVETTDDGFAVSLDPHEVRTVVLQ